VEWLLSSSDRWNDTALTNVLCEALGRAAFPQPVSGSFRVHRFNSVLALGMGAAGGLMCAAWVWGLRGVARRCTALSGLRCTAFDVGGCVRQLRRAPPRSTEDDIKMYLGRPRIVVLLVTDGRVTSLHDTSLLESRNLEAREMHHARTTSLPCLMSRILAEVSCSADNNIAKVYSRGLIHLLQYSTVNQSQLLLYIVGSRFRRLLCA
jgi:hypothetical protein